MPLVYLSENASNVLKRLSFIFELKTWIFLNKIFDIFYQRNIDFKVISQILQIKRVFKKFFFFKSIQATYNKNKIDLFYWVQSGASKSK